MDDVAHCAKGLKGGIPVGVEAHRIDQGELTRVAQDHHVAAEADTAPGVKAALHPVDVLEQFLDRAVGQRERMR